MHASKVAWPGKTDEILIAQKDSAFGKLIMQYSYYAIERNIAQILSEFAATYDLKITPTVIPEILLPEIYNVPGSRSIEPNQVNDFCVFLTRQVEASVAYKQAANDLIREELKKLIVEPIKDVIKALAEQAHKELKHELVTIKAQLWRSYVKRNHEQKK